LGYFEYYEGHDGDSTTYTGGPLTPPSLLGDHDDVLMFTSRSRDEPFIGRNGNGGLPFTSDTAEVVWWSDVVNLAANAQGAQRNGMRTIYRRVLLIAPGVANQIPAADFTIGMAWSLADFQFKYDLSARVVGSNIVLNSLGDLTDRRNRYAHTQNPPYPFVALAPFPSASARFGEDVMLRNALAFDLRAFDPMAPLMANSGVMVGPGDPGYNVATANVSNAPRGAYVDLGYDTRAGFNNVSWFSDEAVVGLGPGAGYSFDTWPTIYESDGVDQDGDGLFDEGTDGFDNDGANGVDDPGERETTPPYSRPLRGIQATLRVYEPDSRQARQVSLIQNFVPE
jgi:hypothetical protein